jgi:hypothetical protein
MLSIPIHLSALTAPPFLALFPVKILLDIWRACPVLKIAPPFPSVVLASLLANTELPTERVPLLKIAPPAKSPKSHSPRWNVSESTERDAPEFTAKNLP